ncbi:MAG: glycine betaine ABC transporter substrate-binding protein [Rhodothalassiaceae bacterium]
MRGRLLALLLALVTGSAPAAAAVVVGSKTFTESVILGEIVRLRLAAAGVAASHRRALGGTRILFAALERGEIDVYAEYTGTLRHEILAGMSAERIGNPAGYLADIGIVVGPRLGFDNSYALAIRPGLAARRRIDSISDLARAPDLRLGFSNEFMDRADGWPGLRLAFGRPLRADGLDHDLAYRGIAAGHLDVIDVYRTDAEIPYYGLRLLGDDRRFFPDYAAVLLYRADLARRSPAAVAALEGLEGRIDVARMQAMNRAVKLDGFSESRVAGAFLAREMGIAVAQPQEDGLARRLRQRVLEHLVLVALSLGAAILLAVPLGVAAVARPRLGAFLLSLAGLVQTIPALALFVFLIPLLGIGTAPTLVALFLYSLLPILRATHAGIAGIPAPQREAAAAIGLGRRARLLRVELPLALPVMLSGIKTAAVITVGLATLGALIGAGGLGQPILTGIRLADTGLILEGAIPAALMALLITWLFDRLERWLTPRGLRLERARTPPSASGGRP